jgi:ABC-type molybdenum transport system ATPase subunit/photorepair protein PhrA
MGLSVGEVIATGWEGVFSRRSVDKAKEDRSFRLLKPFEDLLVTSVRQRSTGGLAAVQQQPDQLLRDIYDSDFAHFTPNQQALILFLRAIVSRPKLLALDEASQGMDEQTWARCRKLLEQEWEDIEREGGEQAVICVSHWEEEVPWDKESGDVLRLHDGKVAVNTAEQRGELSL